MNLEELLWRPLNVVSRLFAQKRQQTSSVEDDLGLVEMMEQLSIGKEVELPSLNHVPLSDLKDGMMVRYRGMVQDILNPEYYLAVYEEAHKDTGQKNVKSAKYRDVLDSNEDFEVIQDSPNAKFGQRLRVYCVPIPGQTEWAENMLKPKTTFASPAQEDVSMAESDGDMDIGDESMSRRRPKRTRDEQAEDKSDPASMDVDNTSEAEAKDGRAIPAPSESSSEQRIKKDAAPNLNFPIPGSSGVACVVKIYEDNEDTFKVSEIVEFEGILSHRYEVNLADGDEEEDRLMMRDYAPPAGLVPQLHCVRYRKLSSVNPHTGNHLSNVAAEWIEQRGGATAIQEARQALVDHLTHCLFGDKLAAEYLLMHLLSRVYARVSELDPLGHFPINFTSIPTSVDSTPIGEYFRGFLAHLVPALHVIALSRETLETTQLLPYKDYDHERLISGQLQLAAGTQLVLDETALTEGQLEKKSYSQLLALGSLISSQRISYDFKYYQSDVPTDLPVIVLSLGKSMFKSALQIPIVISPEWRFDATRAAEQNILVEFQYFLAMLKLMDVQESDESFKKYLQDFFVSKRQENPKFSADTFRNLLTVSRLLAVSCGETRVTEQRWNHSLALENERSARVDASNSSKST